MITRRLAVVATGCLAVLAATAPMAYASGGSGSGGGGNGGGGNGGGGASSCQIRQLSDAPVLFATSAGIDTTFQLAGCAARTWSITFANTALGTTDFTAAGTLDATGTFSSTVHAAPLPFNYPYRVTLTVAGPAGTTSVTKADTLFTPKPRD